LSLVTWSFLKVNYSRVSALEKEKAKLDQTITGLTESTRQVAFHFEPAVLSKYLATPGGARTGKAQVARIRIVNDSTNEAKIIAEIRYSDAVIPVTFSPKQPRRLDVAVRFENETAWYAMDNIAPFYGYKVEKYRLRSPISINVSLKGARDTVARSFQITDENGISKFDTK
jgi:hypothetical protein